MSIENGTQSRFEIDKKNNLKVTRPYGGFTPIYPSLATLLRDEEGLPASGPCYTGIMDVLGPVRPYKVNKQQDQQKPGLIRRILGAK